jgi:lipid-binding SYLF domain-containing protein
MRRFIQAIFALICLACLVPGIAMARDYDAGTRAQINTKVDAELSILFANVPGSQDVLSRAAGVLVFPRSGFMVGGQHGGGALRVADKSVGYYYTDRMTYDVRPGSRDHAVAIAFMTQDALQRVQADKDWDVGTDPTASVVTASAGGKIAASQLDKPVQIFVFDDKGLVGPVQLAGAKVTKVD